jgi:3-methyladenine DNA glycosylase Mpg
MSKLLQREFGPSEFDTLADILLNKTLLHAGKELFRLCEIEFYYFGLGHTDEYTHCSTEQAQLCKFYFHKHKTGTYKSGTFKGLDITMGRDGTYFGILIRSIQNIKTAEFTEGPCRVVDKILSEFGVTRVDEFIANKTVPLPIYDMTNKFYIFHHSKLKQEKIASGPRVGLSAKYPKFSDLKYRRAIRIHHIKRQKSTLK